MIYIEQVSSLALQNKYTKWYCSIVSRAQLRASTRKSAKEILGYTEKHHILPKSFKMGGEKDKLNYAYLSAEEHLVCHLLLAKMFAGEFKVKMCFALHSMCRVMKRNKQLKLTSWEYKKLKEANSYARSNSVGTFKDKNHNPESKELMRINANGFKKGYTPWNKGIPTPDTMKQNQAIGREKYRKENPNWADQCREARKIGESKRLEACRKLTEIDGVIYPSASEAARQLGLKKITLIKRIKSPTFTSYRYVEHT
jgi:hypothetical protein